MPPFLRPVLVRPSSSRCRAAVRLAQGARSFTIPLLVGPLLASLFAVALCACRPGAQDASQIPHTPIPKTPAHLAIEASDGALRYQGVVADDGARVVVINALESANPGKVSGRLELDANTAQAPWATRPLGSLAAALRRTGGSIGIRVEIQGHQIELDGDRLSQEDRATLLQTVRKLYPGYALTGQFQGVDPNQALPEPGDLAGLLDFLNRTPLMFQTGSGMLAPVSVEALTRAARGIRAAGDVGRLELRIYPETTGEATDNRELARQRGEAVTTQLALRGVPPAHLSIRILAADAARPGAVEFAAAPADTPAAAGDGRSATAADAHAANAATAGTDGALRADAMRTRTPQPHNARDDPGH